MTRSAGGLSVATRECAQQLVEGIVEVVGNDETSLVDAEHRPSVLNGNEPRHRPPRPRDDDLLSGSNLPQQPGEMSLGLVDADSQHYEHSRLSRD